MAALEVEVVVPLVPLALLALLALLVLLVLLAPVPENLGAVQAAAVVVLRLGRGTPAQRGLIMAL